MLKFKVFVALVMASSFMMLPGVTQEAQAKGKLKNFLKQKLNPLGYRMQKARDARKACEASNGKNCKKEGRKAFFKRQKRGFINNDQLNDPQ